MRTKLKEGMIIRSEKFVNGYPGETDIQANDKFVITKAEEELPQMTIGNRTSSYENSFVAIRLNADGSYDEAGKVIKFSTSHVFVGVGVPETDIEVLGQMKKVFVLDSNMDFKTPSKWSDYDKKIKEYETLLNETRAEKAAFEALSDEEQLAIRLHTQRCTSSHEDMCGWYYEIDKEKGHNWEGTTHKHWFEKSKQIIDKANQVGVSVDVALQILEAGK